MTGDNRRFSRRTALKSGSLAAGALAVGRVAVGRATAQTTVTGGGGALQAAIDAAGAGETIVVTDDESYDPIVVDVEGLTVETDAGATIDGAGTTVAVSIEADGVTVSGFAVTNPGGLLGIKVERGVDDATVEANTVEDVGPTGDLGVTGIIVGQGDHSGIEIANNEIGDLLQQTDGGFASANGILFDAEKYAPAVVEDSSVVNNTIRGIESDGSPLGIVVQHETIGVSIVNNDISDLVAASNDDDNFDYAFAQGINIDSPETTDTSVVRNDISNVTSDDITAEAVKIDGDGGGVTFRANSFDVAIGVNNRNGTDDGARDPDDDPVVDARNNYWGSSDGPEVAEFNGDADADDQADVIGNVAFEPFLRTEPGGGGGRGRGDNGGGSGNAAGGGNGSTT